MKKIINHSGYLRTLAFVIPYFVTIGIFQFIAFGVVDINFLDINEERTSIQRLTTTFFTCFGAILITWIFTKFVDKDTFSSIRFVKKDIHKDLINGFIIGFILILFGSCILFITNKITLTRVNFQIKDLVITSLIFSFVAIGEEIVFRGYILKNLLISFNKYIALFISAILFSLMHIANPDIGLISLISLIMAGLLYGILFIQSQSIWLPITAHLSWNLFQSLFGFNVSGISNYKLLEINPIGEQSITGGKFGFEGSIYSILIQAVVIIIFIYLTEKKTNHNIL